MMTLALLFLGGILLTIGDIVFKQWIVENGSYLSMLYVGGLCIYLIGLVFLVESFRSENIAVASTVFVVANVVTLALVSWLYFGEKLSVLQVSGIALALVSVALLEMGQFLQKG